MSFNDDMIRRSGLPADVMGLIHDLCYHTRHRDVEDYVKRAQRILSVNGCGSRTTSVSSQTSLEASPATTGKTEEMQECSCDRLGQDSCPVHILGIKESSVDIEKVQGSALRRAAGELQNIVDADFKGMREDFGLDANRQFRLWAQNRARNTLAQLLREPAESGRTDLELPEAKADNVSAVLQMEPFPKEVRDAWNEAKWSREAGPDRHGFLYFTPEGTPFQANEPRVWILNHLSFDIEKEHNDRIYRLVKTLVDFYKATSVGRATDEQSAAPVTPSSHVCGNCGRIETQYPASASPASTQGATTDKERLDWLDTLKVKMHAHWGGGPRPDDPSYWVDPTASWLLSHSMKCGTHEYPAELSKITLREAIDSAMSPALPLPLSEETKTENL